MWTRAGCTRARESDIKSMLLCHSAHSSSLLTTWEPESLAKFRVRGDVMEAIGRKTSGEEVKGGWSWKCRLNQWGYRGTEV